MQSEARPPSPFIDEQSKPVSSLVQLADLFDLPHDNTFQSLLYITQQRWVQKGKERWDYEELYPAQKRIEALALLTRLGCIEAILATQERYDYALVLGGFAPRMEMRIQSLVQEWKRGVRFRQIVLLAGARPLDPRCEKDFLASSTEGELLQALWHKHSMPDEMRQIPVTLLIAPMKPGPVRPNTADTVLLWLNTNPAPGRCLVVTSQPFIGYQNSVFQTLLPSSFPLETVGADAPDDTALSVHLDNLTKWMYQENIRCQGQL